MDAPMMASIRPARNTAMACTRGQPEQSTKASIRPTRNMAKDFTNLQMDAPMMVSILKTIGYPRRNMINAEVQEAIKEGGKCGVEIEAAADMGGLQPTASCARRDFSQRTMALMTMTLSFAMTTSHQCN